MRALQKHPVIFALCLLQATALAPFARAQLLDLREVNGQIAEHHTPTPEDWIDGSYFRALLEKNSTEPTHCESVPCCPLESKDSKEKQVHEKEIVLIVDANTPTQIQNTPIGIPAGDINAAYTDLNEWIRSIGLPPSGTVNATTPQTKDDLLKAREQLMGIYSIHYPPGVIIPPLSPEAMSARKDTFYIETLFYTADIYSRKSNVSEKELVRFVAEGIASYTADEEERYNMMTRFSGRMNAAFNQSRNPFSNNNKNNPKDMPIPEGDLSFAQVVQAVATNDLFSGPVCNDAVEMNVLVGQELFPDKDVLAITGGTHFGLIIADSKKVRVIDVMDQADQKGMLSLNLAPVTDIRVSKVEDGKLKQIAKMSTEFGDFTQQAFGSQTPILRSGARINTVMLSAQNHWKKNEEKYKKNLINVAAARGSSSNMAIVVAESTVKTKNTDLYGGTGVSAVQSKDETVVHVHVRAGFDRNLIRYQSNRVQLHFSSGAHSDFSKGIATDSKDLSGGIDLRNRLKGNYKSGSTTLTGDVQAIHSIAPKSWGDATGALSDGDFKSIVKTIGLQRFRLNQISADVTSSTKTGNTTSLVNKVHYQGSNVGQNASALSGIQFTPSPNTQLFFYVGAETSKLKGYKTKYSLLQGPSGGKTGVTLKNKNSNYRLEVNGIGSKAPGASGGATIPLLKKKKH